jgi:transposase InsO family protein
LLQPLPIPEKPFEVVSMDFITELPESNGYDSILVVVDKLTKYAIFIPTYSTVDEVGMAQLFFEQVVSKFGLPRQIISDRDPRWTGAFWKETCKQLNIRRGMSTAYHPQTDGQTEIMNQILETALRSYVSPNLDDWSSLLHPFCLAYNNTPHSATSFAPAFLLYGFTPLTPSNLLHPSQDFVNRPRPGVTSPSLPIGHAPKEPIDLSTSESDKASEFIAEFHTFRDQAGQALQFAQATQQRNYNQGRIIVEFNVGDRVLVNPHSLGLLRSTKGRGKKLLMKYDGPFEVSQKLGPATYRLRMPASYGIHPVLNIAHLERYQASDADLGDRPQTGLSRLDFSEVPEYEVDSIIQE